MKRNILFLFLFFYIFSLNAQDLIITKTGDSIRCQITKITSDNIYFRYLKSGGVEKSLLPISEINDYQYFQPGSPNQKGGIPPERNYPRFRLSAGGGYTYRVEKIPDDAGDYKDYFRKLKSGFNIETEAGYFFKKSFGVGLRYNFFRTKNSMDNVTFIIDDGHTIDTVTGNMGDDIRIHYLEPVFYYRFFNRNEKVAWTAGVSLGYAAFVNKAMLMNEDLDLTSSTVGISVILGADFFVAENLAVGLTLSADIGTLTKMTRVYKGTKTTKQLPVQERVDISLINLTAGVRFWK
jgi:hypothetical protein